MQERWKRRGREDSHNFFSSQVIFHPDDRNLFDRVVLEDGVLDRDGSNVFPRANDLFFFPPSRNKPSGGLPVRPSFDPLVTTYHIFRAVRDEEEPIRVKISDIPAGCSSRVSSLEKIVCGKAPHAWQTQGRSNLRSEPPVSFERGFGRCRVVVVPFGNVATKDAHLADFARSECPSFRHGSGRIDGNDFQVDCWRRESTRERSCLPEKHRETTHRYPVGEQKKKNRKGHAG